TAARWPACEEGMGGDSGRERRALSVGDESRHTDATSNGLFGSELGGFEAFSGDDDFGASKARRGWDSDNLGVDWNRPILIGIRELSSDVLRMLGFYPKDM
ncbi:hypothetical protein Dimus_002894, partial [Dionaea muscipula]